MRSIVPSRLNSCQYLSKLLLQDMKKGTSFNARPKSVQACRHFGSAAQNKIHLS